jgi:diguanylate cyclase (GGDEF)-like protein
MKPLVPISARRLTRSYIVALSIIAGLTILSHLALAFVVQQNQNAAAIINISGRQRMLSQRIASLAAEYRLGDESAKPPLIAAINQFETVENRLSQANRTDHSQSIETLSSRNIYVGGAQPLDILAVSFVVDARRVAALPPGDPAAAAPLARMFAAARTPLLTKLDDVVSLHKDGAEAVLVELEVVQLVTLALVLLTLAVEGLTIFRPMIRWVIGYTGEIVRLATIDPLTEVANRRGFLERFEAERARAARFGRPLCLLMLDIDHFKMINDTFGHDGGDEALRAMAECCRHSLRTSDFLGRLGGEEFAILLPETDLAGAALLAERLRAAVQTMILPFETQRVGMTVSVGVVRVGHEADAVQRALQDADALMYRAKRSGRNCVVSDAHAGFEQSADSTTN